MAGSLTVNGTTTTINSTTLTVDDKNIEIGSINTPTDATANGGGITLKGSTDKTILWSNASQSWNFSENVILNDGKYLSTDRVQGRDSSGLALVDDSGNGIFVQDGGNVGVGTSSPGGKLSVMGPNAVGTFFTAMNTGAAGAEFKRVNAGSAPYNHFLFHNGNVGIGNATPDYPLDVIGTLRVSEAQTWLRSDSNSSATLYVDQSGSAPSAVFNGGSVGIGTASPKFKLDVADPSTMVLGGSDDGLGVTDNAFKSSRIGGIAYTNASKPVNMMMHTSSATESNLFIGWGTGSMNCPTKITFGTASNTTTGSSTAANKRMVIDSAGHVGIGTSSPIYPLEVFGKASNSISVTSTHADGTRIQHAALESDSSGFGQLKLFTDVGNPLLGLSTNGNSYFNGGKVGIGTSSPDSALHIVGDDNTNSQIHLKNTTFSSDPADFFITPVYSGNQLQIRNSTATPILNVNGDGKVGIGTTNPGATLDVNGSIMINNQASNPGLWFGQGSANARGYIGGGNFAVNGGATGDFGISAAIDGNLLLGASTSTGGTAHERMRITSRGSVGIGTNNPGYLLSVHSGGSTVGHQTGTAYINTCLNNSGMGLVVDATTRSTGDAATSNFLVQDWEGSPSICAQVGGNVGIGTVSPGYQFTVEKEVSGTWLSRIYNTGSGATAGNTLLVRSAATNADNMPVFGVHADGNYKFLVKSNGYAGLSTTAPQSKLDISGSNGTLYSSTALGQGGDSCITLRNSGTAANTFASIDFSTNADRIVNRVVSSFTSVADGYLAFVTEGGNVAAERLRINHNGIGIGTTTPEEKVHVKGDAGDNNGDVALRIHNPNAGATTTSSIRFSNTTSAFDHAAIVATREGTGSHLGSLTFYTNQNFKPNYAAMIIDSFGNVGIGNASHNAPYPYYKSLKVGKSSTLMGIADESANYDQVYLQSNYYTHSDGTNRAYGVGYPSAIGLITGQFVFSASPTIASAAGDTQSLNTVMTINRFGTTTVNVGANPGAGRHTIKQNMYNDTTNFFRVQDLNSNAVSELGLYREPQPSSGAVDAWSYWLATCRNSTTNNIIYSDNQTLKMALSYASANAGGGSIVGSQTSDERLKDIHENFSYGLSDVLKLTPISYTLKEDTTSTTKLGFGAQTTQQIIPETVRDTGDCIDGYEQPEDEDSLEMIPKSDDTKLEMEYVQLIPVLTKAIQEQQSLIEDLKNRISALENK